MKDFRLRDVVAHLLTHLDNRPDREGLNRTPDRVAEFYRSFLGPSGLPFPLTTFDSEGMDEMIVVGRIPFYSLCEHHLLPFFGHATVGYVPTGRIVGLSKIPRVVAEFSRRLQNQERITQQVADCLVREVEPKGVGVVLHARHLCMEMRGIAVAGVTTTTSALRGVFLEDSRCRREFLDFDANQGGG